MTTGPRRAPRSFVIIALIVVGLLSAVAGYLFGGMFGPAAGGGDNLAGTRWKLIGWSVSSSDPAAVEITAEFSDGRIGGNSGVNSYGGDYTVPAPGKLTIGETVMTMMAGPEPAMQAEAIYHELLRQVGGYRLNGDQLTLLDGNGNELLIFARVLP